MSFASLVPTRMLVESYIQGIFFYTQQVGVRVVGSALPSAIAAKAECCTQMVPARMPGTVFFVSIEESMRPPCLVIQTSVDLRTTKICRSSLTLSRPHCPRRATSR